MIDHGEPARDPATLDLATVIADLGSWHLAGDIVGLPDGLFYCAVAVGQADGPASLLTWDPASAASWSTS